MILIKKWYLIISACILTLHSNAQDFDIVNVMSYNLLNYRNTTSYCDGNNNSSSAKEGYLTTIIDHTTPDLFIACEIGANVVNANKILERCLNTNGRTGYAQASYSATPGSSLTNMLFYNTNAFTLYAQDAIENDLSGNPLVRLIDVYTLFYNADPNLTSSKDTSFITVFAAHLKAGDGTSDRNQRLEATEAVMSYITNNNIGSNYIFAGDLNVQSSGEDSYEELTENNGSYNLEDPINANGNWNNNPTFAFLHTQSTRTSANTNGGCFSGGGMDDRFDFILISNGIRTRSHLIKYINSSYKALGQDGNRFNESINFPANTSEPADVIDALFGMSDHLPVLLDLQMTHSTPNAVNDVNVSGLKVINPVLDHLTIQSDQSLSNATVKIFDITGKLIHTEIWNGRTIRIEATKHWTKGMYLVQITSENRVISTHKIIKQ